MNLEKITNRITRLKTKVKMTVDELLSLERIGKNAVIFQRQNFHLPQDKIDNFSWGIYGFTAVRKI